ncbi:hypothetical protein CANARDRAFT_237681 [[Candida] arabinofermentans NRRL YB-2248]|uniref:Superkiller protein 3 n=1 Tax=[Candida] arabinofermentans NRRL YB-2248 TaxID=983967 RepID=A0A1E4SVL4_9ASCO|nr:hypothetical protein CANARDRAFT_237681 [[Candida] arabinofermentans NRRL YB-2248]
MSMVKNLLKQAKSALKDEDYDQVIYLCDKIVEDLDPKNYFAWVFKGKACSLRKGDDSKQSIESYLKATEIDSNELPAWKGLVQVLVKNDDYELFFKCVTSLAIALDNKNESLNEVIKSINMYMQRFTKSITGLEEYYLKHVIPGTTLGELIGQRIDKPAILLNRLITLLQNRENIAISTSSRLYKMKVPSTMNEKQLLAFNAIIWKHYEKSELPELYQQYLNICDSDKYRRKFEEKYLMYRYEMLKVAPTNLKKEISNDIMQMISGMITIKSPSQFAWELYFEWLDPVSIADLDLSQITDFIKLFGNVGLGSIFYAWILSDVSPYDKDKVHEYLKAEDVKQVKPKKKKQKKKLKILKKTEEQDDNEDQVVDEKIPGGASEEQLNLDQQQQQQQQQQDTLSLSDILEFMTKGLETSPKSIIGHRIVIDYFIHIKEYETALSYCKSIIPLISTQPKITSIDLPNARKESILKLATVYTYYESPKNFPKALTLFDKVLAGSPDNMSAKIGKGLILAEKGEFKNAEVLLSEVLKESPDDWNAMMEHSWCNIQLGNYETGRDELKKTYKMIIGTDANSFEIRSNALWRISESYLLEANESTDNTNIIQLVKSAYDNLIESLKQNSSNSSSYTSLGLIFLNYYDNKTRALNCFYKALQLDSGDLLAAKELARNFSNERDWEMVDMICHKIISSEKGKRMLSITTDDPSWPYRMLGCSALERQDDIKAIEFFQNALRIQPSDISSWVGLGESYLARGRLEASMKVFSHALTLDESNWQARYLLAVVHSSMGEFDEGVLELSVILDTIKPRESCVITALFETLVSKVLSEIDGGYISRSFATALQAFDVMKLASEVNPKSHRLWISLSDLLRLLLKVQTHIPKIPFDIVDQILENAPTDSDIDEELLTEVNSLDSLNSIDTKTFKSESKFVELCCYYMIQSSKKSLACASKKLPKLLRSSLLYNLGISYLESYKQQELKNHRDCAIRLLKKAIHLESSNPDYWEAMGIASLTKNAKVSQHCFIKASSLAPKNPRIWSNLAVLCLHHNDLQLANDCFMRSQSIAPGVSTSWSGQALIAEAHGDSDKANHLFTHSLVISNGTKPLSMLLYGLSLIKRLVGTGTNETDLDMVQELNVASFSMLNYLKYYPTDQLALSIYSIIIERTHDYKVGLDLSLKLCDLLEAKYNELETQEVLIGLSKAKAQLARLYLGEGFYDLAIETAEVSINILNAVDKLDDEIQKCVLSSLTTLGLSYFFNGDFESSITEYKKILDVSPDSKRIIVLISQVLFAFDTAETKQAAVDELLSNIESYGSSLIVVLTLASISIVENMDDYLPAMREELGLSLSLNDRILDGSNRHIPYLLDILNSKLGIENDKIWQRNAFLFPNDSNIWKRLNNNVALGIALNSNSVDSGELSEAYVNAGQLRGIQRGLLLNPQNANGWLALKGCL